MAEALTRAIVIMPWGNEIEDYLGPIGLNLEQFCEQMTGGWLFGFVEALKLSGWHVSIVCVSRNTHKTRRRIHTATGAEIVLLASPLLYRMIRLWINDVYADVGAYRSGFSRRWAKAPLRAAAPYLANPFIGIARAFRRLKPDLVLCQEYEYARFDVVALVCRFLGCRYGATFQGGQHTFSRLEALVRPWSMRNCSALVIASSRECERVCNTYRIDSNRIARIPNPLDLERWPRVSRNLAREQLGWPKEARVAICHSRIDIRRKGLDILLDAWRRVTAELSSVGVRLVLVGDGGDAQKLHEMLTNNPLPGLAWQREYVVDRNLISQLLHAADVYVMASRQEGFPVAPLEGMASCLPVVVTDAPGLAEIVLGSAKPVGCIVPREEPDALAKALIQLLADRELSCAWGANARAYVVEQFSLKAVGCRLAESFERAMTGRTNSTARV